MKQRRVNHQVQNYKRCLQVPKLVSIVLNTWVQFTQLFADGRDKSAPTPTECTLRIIHAYQRLPTCTHCRDRFIVPAYHGIHGVDILCFICFVFHLCHSICALIIFFFRSVAPTHVATTLN